MGLTSVQISQVHESAGLFSGGEVRSMGEGGLGLVDAGMGGGSWKGCGFAAITPWLPAGFSLLVGM